MTAQVFYFEDTCALKANRQWVGTIERTFSDVTTHHPDPLKEYHDGLDRYRGVSKAAFRAFLRTGVPPRGCVLVSWARSGPEGIRESAIIQESKLVLLDRALLVADIVKKSPTDTMSGTVINSSTRVTLMPPFPWPAASSQPGPLPPEATEGCFSSDPETFLEDVPSHELRLTSSYVPGNFIVYHDWVGRIENTEDEITLRLADGSLVVAGDPMDLLPAQETYYVNDFVTTKKANLRLGRWIYGAYNPNINPCGHVAQVRVVALEVRWLASKYPTTDGSGGVQYDEPPFELDEDVLESGEVHLYDESAAPSSGGATRTTGNARVGLELAVGDRVQFKDLTGAAVKYPRLRPIPRSDTLGKDINTFVVQSTRSEVTVLWQDLTTSTCGGKELIPFLDIGDGDEVWPGDMVMTKASVDIDDDTFSPLKFGVVQSVQSQERMATVSWCSGRLVFVKLDTSIMLECKIGPPTGEVETCSFYDITNPSPLERRLGDFVLLMPDKEAYVPRQGRDWFGEIVNIGLDGQLTVRLGAADEVRDIKVPFSSTTVLFSSDLHDEDDDLAAEDDDDEDMSDDYEDDDVEYDIPFDEADDAPWMNENNEIVGEEDQGWTTDEEDRLSDSDDGSDVEMVDSPDDESGQDTNGATNGAPSVTTKETPTNEVTTNLPHAATQSGVSERTPASTATTSTFSYSTMFEAAGMEQGNSSRPLPLNFEILEGTAPASHHFSGQTPSADVQRLRRITAEHKILRSSLPDGVYVRTWEGSLDLLRVLILGPLDTPYEYAPFVIDFSLARFPQEAPQAFFHSWTDGSGPVNPNLYEDGKICLSLLGTWPGEVKHETWSASKSTVLQVLVSILGLVLVREPYYNEAGYEVRAGTVESRIPSIFYSERAYIKTRSFIAHALAHPIAGFERDVETIYLFGAAGGAGLLERALASACRIVRRSRAKRGPGEQAEIMRNGKVSAGATGPLERQVTRLGEILLEREPARADRVARMWQESEEEGEEEVSG